MKQCSIHLKTEFADLDILTMSNYVNNYASLIISKGDTLLPHRY